MVDIWFSTDAHLYHSNILKFTDVQGNRIRAQFNDIDEMNWHIVDEHNKVVKPGDKWYCLGDLTFKYHDAFENLIQNMNGQKRLLLGNHDRIVGTSLHKYFKKIEIWRVFREFGFVASHIPIYPESLQEKKGITSNVHGHVHQNSLSDVRYLNICPEVVGYKPLHVDEIIKMIKKRGIHG